MNSATERAREACESCRKSHKKCTYDDNSTRCLRCEKRNTSCSLFLSVETTDIAQQGPLASATTGSAGSGSWDGMPHDSSTFPYQFPPQETYYWPTTLPAFTEPPQGEYPAENLIFQSIGSAIPNQQESEEPAMNHDGLYAHNNVFNDHIGS